MKKRIKSIARGLVYYCFLVVGSNAAVNFHDYIKAEGLYTGEYGEIVGENAIVSRKYFAIHRYQDRRVKEIFTIPWVLIPFSSLWRREELPSFYDIENQRPKDIEKQKQKKDTVLPELNHLQHRSAFLQHWNQL